MSVTVEVLDGDDSAIAATPTAGETPA